MDGLNGGEAIDQNIFPKYLTSRKLLFLQMADSQFRRTILFQVGLCVNYEVSIYPKIWFENLCSSKKNFLGESSNGVCRT